MTRHIVKSPRRDPPAGVQDTGDVLSSTALRCDEAAEEPLIFCHEAREAFHGSERVPEDD